MSNGPLSEYLNYLPAIYRDNPFLNQFLALLEEPLRDIEKTIGDIPAYFDPDRPDRNTREFLEWLAGWVALTLRQDWDEAKQRQLIKRIAAIYPIRGTKAGLEQLLGIYVGQDPGGPSISIQEQLFPFQIGVHSTVGVDTLVGGGVPHHFTVRIDFPVWKSDFLAIKQRAVTDIVDLEKPAHTYYTLEVLIPTLQVGVRCTIGMDTVLGNKNS